MANTTEQGVCVKLVEAIEKYPCLYNHKLPDYSNRDVVETAWTEVAYEVNKSEIFCKEKWKNVRTAFVRSLRAGPTGISRKIRKPYYLRDFLQFLVPFVKPSTSNTPENLPSPSPADTEIDEDENEFDEILYKAELRKQLDITTTCKTESTESEGSGPSRALKRKAFTTIAPDEKQKASDLDDLDRTFSQFSNSRPHHSHEDDPTKMFLLSLVPDLQQMTSKQLRQFKRRVLEVIDEILFEERPLSRTSYSSLQLRSPPSVCLSMSTSSGSPSPIPVAHQALKTETRALASQQSQLHNSLNVAAPSSSTIH